METRKKGKQATSISLCPTKNQRFNSNQIRTNAPRQINDAGVPKPIRKLIVGRSGKIGYSK